MSVAAALVRTNKSWLRAHATLTSDARPACFESPHFFHSTWRTFLSLSPLLLRRFATTCKPSCMRRDHSCPCFGFTVDKKDVWKAAELVDARLDSVSREAVSAQAALQGVVADEGELTKLKGELRQQWRQQQLKQINVEELCRLEPGSFTAWRPVPEHVNGPFIYFNPSRNGSRRTPTAAARRR